MCVSRVGLYGESVAPFCVFMAIRKGRGRVMNRWLGVSIERSAISAEWERAKELWCTHAEGRLESIFYLL